eukprot:758347-Hanusia_phi.AAC.3
MFKLNQEQKRYLENIEAKRHACQQNPAMQNLHRSSDRSSMKILVESDGRQCIANIQLALAKARSNV